MDVTSVRAAVIWFLLSHTEVEGLIAEMLTARGAKDYGRADELREQLVAGGVVLLREGWTRDS